MSQQAIQPKIANQQNQTLRIGSSLQIVKTKAAKGINQEEILRIFNEQLEREQREREQVEKKRMEMRHKAKEEPKPINKRVVIQEETAPFQPTLKQTLLQKSARIRSLIEANCKKYHMMFRPSIYDTKFMRYRFECKQKLFMNLSYGLQELRDLLPTQLSQAQKQMLTQDPYVVLKRLVAAVDAEMCKILNKGDKHEVSRQYRMQWETFLSNIKDQANFELKRKILCQRMDGRKIALAKQMDFFTRAKREEELDWQKRYVAEFTVEKVILTPLYTENAGFFDYQLQQKLRSRKSKNQLSLSLTRISIIQALP